MSDLAISDLTEAEVPAAVALWEQAGLTRPWNDPWDDAKMAMEGPSSTILAGRIDGALVATIMVGWDGHRGAIYYFATSDASRGQGVGLRMIRAAEDWLGEHFNAPKLNLVVRNDNPGVHAFYEKAGYGLDPVTARSKRLRP